MTEHPLRAGALAVIGSGVAGLRLPTCSAREARVTLFEADTRLGGHADTHVVDGHPPVDTGFIVHNERTYPNLMRLFDELDVQTQDSDMSMSVRSDDFKLEWAGALGFPGLFPTWRNAVRPSYLRMLVEIPRFHWMARRVLAAVPPTSDETLASFLEAPGGSPRCSARTSWSRWSPASGPATRRSRWSTRRATCSASCSTTACCRSSARRSGAP